MRRIRFIRQVVVSGLRWAKELADRISLLLGLLALAASIVVGGVLLHRSAWFLGVLGCVLVLATLFEGAFRVWDEADKRAEAAEASADGSLVAWLGLRIKELRGLLVRLEEVLDAPQFDPPKAETVQDHFFEIVRDVDRKLHTSAPEWVDYFSESAARYPVNLRFPHADGYRKQLVPSIQSTIDQIAHIQSRL